MSDLEVITGKGHVVAVVWPVYMGVATHDPGNGWIPMYEPYGDLNYNRGQITWRYQPDGDILGSALVYAPKGVYTHFIFAVGPHAHGMIGNRQIEHPIIFDRPGVVDITPIRNQDYLPRQSL